MKRAIVKRFIVVLIVAMAISSIVISMSYYRLASHRVMEDMKPVLLLLDATIDWESSDLEKQIAKLEREIEKQEQLVASYEPQIAAAATDYQELTRLWRKEHGRGPAGGTIQPVGAVLCRVGRLR